MMDFPYDKPLYARRTPVEVLEETYSILEVLGISRDDVVVNGIEVLVEPVSLTKTAARKARHKALVAVMKWFGSEWVEEKKGRIIMPGEQSTIALKLNGIRVFFNPTKDFDEAKLAALVVLKWRVGLNVNGRTGLIEIDEWENNRTVNLKELGLEEVKELVARHVEELDRELESKLGVREKRVVERTFDSLLEELVEDEEKTDYNVEIVEEDENTYTVHVDSKYYDVIVVVNKYSGRILSVKKIVSEEGVERIVEALGLDTSRMAVKHGFDTVRILAIGESKTVLVEIRDNDIVLNEKLPGFNEIREHARKRMEEKARTKIGDPIVEELAIKEVDPPIVHVKLDYKGVKYQSTIRIDNMEVEYEEIEVTEEAVKNILEEKYNIGIEMVRSTPPWYIASGTDGVRNYIIIVEYPLKSMIRKVELSRHYAIKKSREVLAKLGLRKPRLKSIESDENGGWITTWISGAVKISVAVDIHGRAKVVDYDLNKDLVENMLEYYYRSRGEDINILRIQPIDAKHVAAYIIHGHKPLTLKINAEELTIES